MYNALCSLVELITITPWLRPSLEADLEYQEFFFTEIDRCIVQLSTGRRIRLGLRRVLIQLEAMSSIHTRPVE